MKSYCHITNQGVKLWMIFTLSLLLMTCSAGLRVKNLVNYPLILSSLNALDTLKVLPDVVKYSGSAENTFRSFQKDIRIQGRQQARPVWHGTSQGCFQVNSGANVHILDFNFRGDACDSVLICVDSGRVVLENCDLSDSDNWIIRVGPSGVLELRNTRFSNLNQGAIQLQGGQVKINNSVFDQAGMTAISATKGKLLEAHSVVMTNIMGTAMELDSITEVWLDSVKVIDSFQDGISLRDCDFVLLNQVEVRENGRHGLMLSNASICGLLEFSTVGNLVHGMVLNEVDTLRILNSEFVGNGESGALVFSTLRSKMAGIRVGHNGGDGLKVSIGEELLIHHSTFQANPRNALVVDSLNFVQIEHASIVNNGIGIQICQFDSVGLKNNLMASNGNTAAIIKDGNQIAVSLNLVKGNQNGLVIRDVLNVQLDSNRVISNTMGTDFRSVSQLSMRENIWKSNISACYYSDMGSITSSYDRWYANQKNAFEILSAAELILSNAELSGNKDGGLLNQTSVKIESCTFDSSNGFALKVMNGSIMVNESTFRSNSTAIDLAQGSRAKIVQSQFEKNDLAVDAQASVELAVSFCNIRQARGGLQIGNYGNAQILSNHFDEIDGYSIQLTGPHFQSLLIRQNIMSRTGGIMRSASRSGKIEIVSNTFARNMSGLNLQPNTLFRLEHNIFYKTDVSEVGIDSNADRIRWNCFAPESQEEHPEEMRTLNLYAEPQFDQKYYLLSQSPCLQGGKNGLLIGAQGTIPADRPKLKP